MFREPYTAPGLIAKVARQVAVVNEAGVHYKKLDPTRILFQSTDNGDEKVLLPIPVPSETSDHASDDVYALKTLLRHRQDVASRLSETFDPDENRPDAAAFAEALEAAIEGREREPAGESTRTAPPPSEVETPSERLPEPPPITQDVPPPDRSYALWEPLRETFRYVHEPLRPSDTAIPLLGNEPLIKALEERLVNSVGGTFLVTGFRGAGKSTLIEQALDGIKEAHPRGRFVLPVVLSVARPLETERLLFAIIRRVFEELVEANVLERLPAAVRHSLVTSYMRTSLSFKETRADATERTANLEFAPAKLARGMLGPAGMAIPKAGMSTKRSRSLATEAAFLAYSETDVEHDMMRIIRLLSTVPEQARGWWPWRARPLDLQLVVVLDEVDKLTALQDGLDKVERLLSGIKNVVTMRGAHYLVVAGPDLHDRVLRDSGRGNSIYESIFAWQLYVPCGWSAPKRLLDDLCLREDRDSGVIEEFEKYLRFKSRGILRKLLQELNAFVVWTDDRRPYLRVETRYQDAISFYAELERCLEEFFTATDRQVPPTPLSRDRWRLSAYYVTDWILRTEGRPFTSADVIQEDGDFDPLLRVSHPCVELLLHHLAGQGVLTVVREPARATSTRIPDVAEAQRPSYKLEDGLLDRLFWILAHNEYERAEIDASRALPGLNAPIETLANDRYELWRLIGEGGTSSVYEGRDTLLRRPVAVKMLRTALRSDARARSRFLREATIAGAVHHPGVVDVYEVVTVAAQDDPAGHRYAIVMELIPGPTLDQALENGPLSAREVARLGMVLAGALDYLAGKGLARLDLKPHNIVMNPSRGPVIIDLGIAKIVENAESWLIGNDGPERLADPATQLGIVVGTPAYLSPEQARGEEIDIRSDIYALGLVLCTCLAGRHPYQQLDPVAVMARAMRGGLDTSGLPCSAELRAVLTRATEPDVARRYERPSGLLAALRGTPEGS
ncbi:MAG: serine/threonine-protein kinase [Actinoallomurus sp.]